tara:strand:+ start:659 stop:814 length:156 start_codon:yes stop_codon:yes gene_type:complete
MKKILLVSILSFSFSQGLNPTDAAIDELRILVEAASRSNQRVFVDDFTGLL